MSTLYQWVVFIHVASVLLLLLLHGGVLAVSYAISGERRQERLETLLDLSARTFDSRRPFGRLFWLTLAAVVLSGMTLMLMGGFWRNGWPWASIVIFIAIMLAMTRFGSRPVSRLRRAAGLPWMERERFRRPEWMAAETINTEGIEFALRDVRPNILSGLGAGGFLLLLWLMLFKPF